MNDTNENQKLIETLHIALQLEKEGKALFLQAASETKSNLAKQTFEFWQKKKISILKISNFSMTL